jgi:succinoglycan biosynthesis protein ExoA
MSIRLNVQSRLIVVRSDDEEGRAVMKVSIISPCRNEVSHIDAFIQSLLGQSSEGLTSEFIIADGESDDGTREKLTEWANADPRIKVIRNKDRIVSTGLNRALEAATGDIIVRMDVHTTYNPDYIVECVKELQSTGAMCVGGAWRAGGSRALQRAISAAFTSPFGSGGALSRRADYNGKVDTVYLGTWWRSDLLRLGGFDEDLIRNQDDELCLRITRLGGLIWQSSAIKSTYVPRNSLKALWAQYHQYGYWKVLVIRKHRIPASVRHIVPIAFIAGVAMSLLLMPVHPVFGLLGLILSVAYLSASVAAALQVASRPYQVREILCVVGAFSCMHFGYGFGFAKGILDFFLLRRGPSLAMSRLTR